MKFLKQEIEGVWVIEPEPVVDERGIFRRHFCQREFAKYGIETNIRQTNISENHGKYTLRGFHYQTKPAEEHKTLSCLQGGIYNITVDLRCDSKTFLQWIAVELSARNKRSFHVPGGCANAYLTLEDNTIIHYYMSEYYSPLSYRGFRYNDPLFNFIWPTEPLIISVKDKMFPDFDPMYGKQ